MPASQRIGNRPNVRQMIERFATVSTVPLSRYRNVAIQETPAGACRGTDAALTRR